MKTVKTTLNVKWLQLGTSNEYTTQIGNYMANVSGKNYYIHNLATSNYREASCPIFKAKSRSNTDALQRATNKLVKLASV